MNVLKSHKQYAITTNEGIVGSCFVMSRKEAIAVASDYFEAFTVTRFTLLRAKEKIRAYKKIFRKVI